MKSLCITIFYISLIALILCALFGFEGLVISWLWNIIFPEHTITVKAGIAAAVLISLIALQFSRK
jgi:hypothetical protein